ncbi:ABC transporter substrate-binding protein [Paenibacillus aceris]|uniref:Sn-glycerol 3-phosphate transport system substrate-binding protein n=1 Tax=Paenibacillus aceris TaxID=869555 RepID=A0ABS4I6G1_9BACL|nr:ABC transporter substrate-binding protein [Paenibacillus aceris]MBP1966413.1 sn-glycerol 3-phosphate transport system substrate-binding protein [Paenibacillus aceris]NHW39606.1 ABC transporter substrate-binding protein [Paenibacillus aceris]
MNKFQRKVSVPIYTVFILLLFGIFGISYTIWGNQAAGKGIKAGAAEATSELTVNGVKKIVWWHSMSGENGKVVDKLVSGFNASHKDMKVEAVYQGSYYDSLTKLKASIGSTIEPTMVQVYDIGTRFMIDSKAITPIQNFIDQEKYDTSQLDEAIMNYYTVGDTLYSMPFNASNPILYYNKDMFSAAGLNPDKPPVLYEDVAQAAKKLTKEGVWGGYFGTYSWYMEQLVANQGAELVNNGNGRDGLATAWQLNGKEGVMALTWWKGLVDSKVALHSAGKADGSKKAFAEGRVAMIFDTTAALRDILSSVDGKFEVGTGFFPKAEGSDYAGVGVGGGSNWIMNSKSEDEQQAAWAFMKYLSEPEQQAFFHVNTGYFPITKMAYDLPLVQDNMKQFPQFKTAIDQHNASKLNKATLGGVLGVYPDARKLTEEAINQALSGQKSPQEALDAAALMINAKIVEYNRVLN